MFTETIPYPAALLAGLLSFFSPCVLPLLPAYFTFITGFSLEELTENCDSIIRKKVFISTIAFVLGFSLVFILMGASVSYLGILIYKYGAFIRVIGGVIIVILGLHLTGVMPIPILYFEKRLHVKKTPVHFLGTFIVGMAFGAGWSPCIGPLLGSILIIAGSRETVSEGMILLGIYSAGMAIPFVIISIFINLILVWLTKATKAMKYINTTAGILLILIGLFLVVNTIAF